jgi:hypothetical protein
MICVLFVSMDMSLFYFTDSWNRFILNGHDAYKALL